MLHRGESLAALPKGGGDGRGFAGELRSLPLDTEKNIRERSYLIWEREGRPPGRSLEHWLQAEAELSGAAKPARARRAAASPAKRAAAQAPKSAPTARRKLAAKDA
jgi:hypothetical protein